jgi:peptide/nickel transport system substrate-binding protein
MEGSYMKRRRALGLGPAALLALHAAQAAPNLPLALAQVQGGTFVFGAPGEPVKLDPAVVEDLESARLTEQIFDTLVMFAGPTTSLRPGLAADWAVSADGLSYFFNLRPGVTFHDGTPCDATAVKWNFDRWMDENNPWRGSGSFIYWSDVAGFNEVIRSVDAVDANTVQINLVEPQGTFLLNLALFAFGIASPAAVMADPDGFGLRPVGTGAFRFVDWLPGDRVVLERNPSYWGDVPTVERVVVRDIPDNGARFLALRSGAIDMMEGLNSEDLPAAQGDRNLQVIPRPPLNVGFINMHLGVQPLGDVRVRHAIASAINRQAIVDALYGGLGMVASQLIPPSVIGWNPDVQGPQYDPGRARQLLAEAGLGGGFAIDFWVMPVSRPYFPNPQAIAEAIVADLRQVGIRANLRRETDWATYLERRNRLEYPMWMLGWTGDTGDPDNFLYYFFGPSTRDDTWRNEAIQGLLRQAQRSPNMAEREEIYRRVNAAVDAELPRIPIAHATVPLVARSSVRGYIANPTATEYYNTITLAR